MDTNMLSEIVKKPNGKVSRKFGRVRKGAVTNAIVEGELRFGASKGVESRVHQRIDALLRHRIEVLDYPRKAAVFYGELRADLQRKGTPIGMNDLLMAAHCLHLKLILVTANVKEFKRVEGLKVENWLEI